MAAYWAFGVSLALALLSARCLYADGAHEFIRVLTAGTFVELWRGRAFAFVVHQLFLVMALKLGITNIPVLTLAFGLGCFLPWPVCLWLCRRFSPETSWIVVLACAAGYLNAAFMAVGEHILAHAFFWPALLVLLFVRPLTGFAGTVLLVCATVLCRCYESMLLLGPVLAGVALWRAIRVETQPLSRCAVILSAALFTLGALIALSGVLYPEMPANFNGYKRGFLSHLFNPPWTIAWTGAWLALAGCVCASPTCRDLITRPVARAALACGLVLWAAWPALMPASLDPAVQYATRFMNCAVPALLVPVTLVAAWRPSWLLPHRARLVTFAAALLLVQSVWHIMATWQWQGYTGIIRGLLVSRQGPIKPSATSLGEYSLGGQALRFDWAWANPCLSLALSPEGRVRCLIVANAKPPWEPFDPYNPATLPDLSRYGIDYRRYIAALESSNAHLPLAGLTPRPTAPRPAGP